MNNLIYLESVLKDHPIARSIIAKKPNASIIEIENYGEVFNRKKQSFRTQKTAPSYIIAKKHGKKVLPTPKLFSIGRDNNYYFSHILNCPFDCSYCFLGGMYRSSDFVHFVNYEDFFDEILQIKRSHQEESVTIFSGYDGDSLALDNITGFCDHFIPFFQKHPTVDLEIRTKSINISPILKFSPTKNIIIAYTLSPQIICEKLEKKTPSLQKRIEALQTLQRLGYTVALRFDPIIDFATAQESYDEFFSLIKNSLDCRNIHSVTIGPFRLPKGLDKRMKKDNPEQRLFSSHQRKETLKHCYQTIQNIFTKEKCYLCVEPSYLQDHPLALV